MRGLLISIGIFVFSVVAFITSTQSGDPTVSLAAMCLFIPSLMAIGWNLNTALRSEIRIWGVSIKRVQGAEPRSRRDVLERGGS